MAFDTNTNAAPLVARQPRHANLITQNSPTAPLSPPLLEQHGPLSVVMLSSAEHLLWHEQPGVRLFRLLFAPEA